MKNYISAHTSFQPGFFTSYVAERFPGPGTFIFIAVAAREHFDQLYISQICELDRLPQHKLHGRRRAHIIISVAQSDLSSWKLARGGLISGFCWSNSSKRMDLTIGGGDDEAGAT